MGVKVTSRVQYLLVLSWHWEGHSHLLLLALHQKGSGDVPVISMLFTIRSAAPVLVMVMVWMVEVWLMMTSLKSRAPGEMTISGIPPARTAQE